MPAMTARLKAVIDALAIGVGCSPKSFGPVRHFSGDSRGYVFYFTHYHIDPRFNHHTLDRPRALT